MAITALHAAASGMRALDEKLNVVANNLANINTVGFKRMRSNFEDLIYQVKREPGLPNAEDEPIATSASTIEDKATIFFMRSPPSFSSTSANY